MGDCNGEDIRSHAYGKGRVVWNQPITEVLKDIGIRPDFTVTGIDNSGRKIDYIHRTTDTEEIYFITNTTGDPLEFEAGFRVGKGYQSSRWDPQDGSVTPCLQYRTESGTTTMPIQLPAITSVFVVFRKQADTEHVTALGHPATAPMPDVTGFQDGKVGFQVTQPGTYTVTTSTGRKGSAEVVSIPATQEISGPWTITFPPDRGAPSSITCDKLIDWTTHDQAGVRYFSGTATYDKTFTLNKALSDAIVDGARIELDLGKVHEVAVVTLNGKDVGILWKPPYQADITSHLKPGENHLTIGVTNVWNNRLVGDAQRADDENITRTNMSGHFKKDSPLLPSGLIGPVRLNPGVPAIIDLGN